ncbi:hypothetical protein CHARACLAT_033287 [Characodon lateralis]|uniref:Uncharacterized protein n=1 Tax=Characodon lateralis TaxID=208331 RepID=A0ABU7E5K9_9TELE|nr:hypothetical protein [Characodon lateralis]
MSIICSYSIFPVVFYRTATRRARSLQALAWYLKDDPKKPWKQYGVMVISCLKGMFSFNNESSFKYAVINVSNFVIGLGVFNTFSCLSFFRVKTLVEPRKSWSSVIYVIKYPDADIDQSPADVDIIVEGVEVLHELSDVGPLVC